MRQRSARRAVDRRPLAERVRSGAQVLAIASALLCAIGLPAGAQAAPPEPEPEAAARAPEAPAAPEAPEASAGAHPEAPPEVAAGFGRLVGVWDVELAVPGPDGSWSAPGEGQRAQWRFAYILDGWAVQDYWISPPPGEPAGDGGRQLGTNLRIYDAEAGHWDVAYVSNSHGKLSTYEAVAADGRIVMTGIHGSSGLPSRITFHDIGRESFDWSMELQGVPGVEDPHAWTEVARIHGVRATGTDGR